VQAMPEQEKMFYSIDEAAALLQVSRDTVRRMIRTGELQAVQVRRQWRIKRESLDKYLK
jgi:excisionase family DNA binding protein